MFKRIFAILMLAGIVGAAAGCNTMHGLGQDIGQGGDNLKNKADEVQRR